MNDVIIPWVSHYVGVPDALLIVDVGVEMIDQVLQGHWYREFAWLRSKVTLNKQCDQRIDNANPIVSYGHLHSHGSVQRCYENEL